MIGRTLGHYRIEAKLGEGGMGVVYKARDTHLDRFVALKVLPPEKVADPERKRRFVQEAKAASALNHPNIVTIHDIACEDGVDFIVMEFVEGRTLAEVIGPKGIKLRAALSYASQIGDALAKAHGAGIVHRDLKPSNIMVNKDEVVKILDFGLAKLTEQTAGHDLAPTVSIQPLTEEGAIVGTIAYMSPEQVEGGKVDARSDIFSFGSVLYEMLTGRRAFSGDSKASTMAAVLREEPRPASEWSVVLPPELDRVLARCLRKDPQRRWQNMSDLKLVLQDLKEESDSGKLSAAEAARRPARPARERLLLLAVSVALLLLAAAAGLLWWAGRKPAAPRELAVSRLTFDSGVTWDPAVCLDGKLVAYASDRAQEGNLDIWVQQISGRQALRLTRHEADDSQPSFSPDGSRIVFRSERDGGGIYLIDALGGEERKIADRGLRPRFSPDGSTISYVEMPPSLDAALNRMFLIPAQGGIPRPLLPEFQVDASLGGAPVWSPDGKFLLFSGARAGDPKTRDWWVTPVEGGAPVPTGAAQTIPPRAPVHIPCAWAGNWIYFIEGTTVEGINLYRVPITPGSWRISGPPQPLTSGGGMKWGASIARDGRMLFPNFSWVTNAWSLPVDAKQGTASGPPEPVTRDALAKLDLSVSGDGSRVALLTYGGVQTRGMEIRLKDLTGGRETAIPLRSTNLVVVPRLSPDGSTLAYRERSADKWISYVVAGEGATGRPVCENCTVLDLFSQGRQAIVQYGSKRLVRRDLTTGAETPVVEASTSVIWSADLSADDRWLVFLVARPNGALSICVAPVREPPVPEQDWLPIVEGPVYVRSPQWSTDGGLIYFVSERDARGCIWAQRLNPVTKRPVDEAFPIFHAHGRYRMNIPKGFGALAVARDKIVFLQAETTGNIWMTQLEER